MYVFDLIRSTLQEVDWWAPQRALDTTKDWQYPGFDDGGRVWALELTGVAAHPRFWRWYAAWVLARISGRVPLGAVSDDRSIEAMPLCPSCGSEQAGLRHFLSECPGTARLVAEAQLTAARSDWGALCREVFGPCRTLQERAKHVRLIGYLGDALCGRPPASPAEPC